MIAFRVSLNGKHVCTAGVRDFGVVTAMVTWVRRRPEPNRDGRRIEEELTAGVDGLDTTANEHLKWLSRRLRVGDRLAIAITESPAVDRPRRRLREDPALVERTRRRYFERLKREYARKPRRTSPRALRTTSQARG